MKDKYDSFLYFVRLFYNPLKNRCVPQLRRLGRKLSPYRGILVMGMGGRVSILDKLAIYSQALSPYEKKRALKKVLLKE